MLLINQNRKQLFNKLVNLNKDLYKHDEIKFIF